MTIKNLKEQQSTVKSLSNQQDEKKIILIEKTKRKTTTVVGGEKKRKYCRIENDNKKFERTAIHSEELKQPTRSKRKATTVVGGEKKRKYCRIENDNKKFERTAIHSEELKQPTRSKRKATTVVGVESKRKYCQIENDNKNFEGITINSEELKQPRFNFDYYFENPNVSLSEEDREYEYGDPVEWNILQSQTSSNLKCDSVDGDCISQISAIKVIEKEDDSDEDEIINIHTPAVTLSNREPEDNEQLCGEVGGGISSDTIINPKTIWLDLEESIPPLIIDTDIENSSHANSEMKEEYIHPLNGETLTPVNTFMHYFMLEKQKIMSAANPVVLLDLSMLK